MLLILDALYYFSLIPACSMAYCDSESMDIVLKNRPWQSIEPAFRCAFLPLKCRKSLFLFGKLTPNNLLKRSTGYSQSCSPPLVGMLLMRSAISCQSTGIKDVEFDIFKTDSLKTKML